MSEINIETVTVEIAKLELEPGDVLVVTGDMSKFSGYIRSNLQKGLQSFVGAQIKVLFMDPAFELSVVKPK